MSVLEVIPEVNPNSPEVESQINDVQTGVGAIGWEAQILRVGSEAEFDGAFATLGLDVPPSLHARADEVIE